MNTPANIVWHVRNRTELLKIRALLSEYAITVKASVARSVIPHHAALLVAPVHARRAGAVILRSFGRRSGVDELENVYA